jgi:hypothetical protein
MKLLAFLPLAVIALVIVLKVVRFAQSSPEKRREIFTPKGGLRIAGSIMVLLALSVGVFLFVFGTASFGAMSAAKDYLREQFGPSASWSVAVHEHTKASTHPRKGSYQMTYKYGKERGALSVEYTEEGGELIYKITPSEKGPTRR